MRHKTESYRLHVQVNEYDPQELLSEIRAVKEAVERLEQNGVAVTSKPDTTTPGGEPAKARAGLDAMKRRFRTGDQ